MEGQGWEKEAISPDDFPHGKGVRDRQALAIGLFGQQIGEHYKNFDKATHYTIYYPQSPIRSLRVYREEVNEQQGAHIGVISDVKWTERNMELASHTTAEIIAQLSFSPELQDDIRREMGNNAPEPNAYQPQL